MARNTQLVLAFFESEGAADDAALSLKLWAKANRRVRLDGVGVLVEDEEGRIKTHKLGPQQGKKGAGIGAALGLLAAIPTGGLSPLEGAVRGGLVGLLFHARLGLSFPDTALISKRLEVGQAAVGVLALEQQAHVVSEKLVELGGVAQVHEVSRAAARQAVEAARTPEGAAL
jgi:uncharacterized membrane protein